MTDKERIDIWNNGFFYALRLMEVKVKKHMEHIMTSPEQASYLNVLIDIDYCIEDRRDDMKAMEFDEDGNLKREEE